MKEEKLVGTKFNRLTVLSEKYKKDHKYTYYVDVLCDCGTTFTLRHGALRGKKPTRSCGCLQKESASKLKDVIPVGSTFGRLTVLADLGMAKKRRRVRAECSCGSGESEYGWESVKSGNSKSCGCLQREAAARLKKTHGMTGTLTYSSWQSMLDRCLNKNCREYPNYGGRGITCDPSWRYFENFYRDMGERESIELNLDRINNELGYNKANCRWADRSVGIHNRRKVSFGVEGSKFIGVCLSGRVSYPYHARLIRGGVDILNKRFRTEIEAAEAYDDASYLIYGDRPNKKLIEEYYKEGIINSG